MKIRSRFARLTQWVFGLVCVLVWARALSVGASSARLTLQADRPGPRVSPSLYGIFFEEINLAGDGGIYAEMVRNRSFEDSNQPEHWTAVSEGEAKCEISVQPAGGQSEFNRQALKVQVNGPAGRGGVANEGYWGIAVRKGEVYDCSLRVRGEDGFVGPVSMALESKDGKVYARRQLIGVSGEWKRYKGALKPNATDDAARLVIWVGRPGTVSLDMVSLYPRKTWKGRRNGLRSDLAGMLQGLKPEFVRFPGGCWVEGDTIPLAYRWKQTIGPLAERRTQYNIWQYQSTHGLGYHEYLQMCEDLKADALFVVNCGMSHRGVVPMEQIGEWVQDALDAVEYANGPASSKWGAVRARNGHPAPFNLKYVEIGNENGGQAYSERYPVFYKALKAKYPNLVLIANDWGGIPKDSPIEVIDEHYYNSPTFFIQNANKYDSYDRNGPKIYVGEYAVTQGSGAGNLAGALGEAVFMTGMERNSDVVLMASYAPLFANLNYKKWNPDLIYFNNSRVYGTPSYYVQKLFAENRPDTILPVNVDANLPPEEPPRGAIGVGTWNTQAEYKDIKVVQGDKVLYESGALQSKQGWRLHGGQWEVKDGALQQTADGDDRRAVIGEPGWHDYTLSLKARKLGGAEGFLIMFHTRDDNNWIWWNIGGWGNTRHAIEQCVDGGKSLVGRDKAGKVETGRWYDIRVELQGANVRCYLDNELVHQARIANELRPLYAVAGRADKGKEIILKTVNVSSTPYTSTIDIQGVEKVHPHAVVTVLTSASPSDENSLDQPLKVAPVEQTVRTAGKTFRYVFPPHSLTVMRLKADK